MKAMKTKKPNVWTAAAIIGVFLGSGLLAACGKSNSSGSAGAGTGVVQTCTGAQCTYPITANTRLGFYAQTSNFYTPGYMNNGSSLQVHAGMQALLKEAMGTCDRQNYTGGLAACTTWMSGAHDIVLYSDTGSAASTVKIIMRSVPGTQWNGYGWYSYSAPSFKEFVLGILGFPADNNTGVFNPLVLGEATVWPVNNSQGFEVRAMGPRVSYAWNKLFQLQVANGKLEDASWNFVLHYNGQQAMSGKAIRCQSQYCGMDTSYFNNPMY